MANRCTVSIVEIKDKYLILYIDNIIKLCISPTFIFMLLIYKFSEAVLYKYETLQKLEDWLKRPR